MQSHIAIDAANTPPTIPKIEKLLTEYTEVYLNNVAVDADYVAQLSASLPQYYVSRLGWSDTISIVPAITNDKILQLQHEVWECARSFRTDATALMQKLCARYSIATPGGLQDLKIRSHKGRGPVDNEWAYFLHGGTAGSKIPLQGR